MYYIHREGESRGPYNKEEVLEHASSDTLVSKGDEWCALSAHPDFVAVGAPVASSPEASQANRAGRFPCFDIELRNGPDRVRQTVLGSELKPFFKKSGIFAKGGVAQSIRWQSQADGSLIGKVGYLRAKNFSVYRFRIQLDTLGSGTLARIEAINGPFSPFLLFLLYLVGFCLCIVGLVFSFIGDKVIRRGLFNIVDNLQRHLKMWDEAT